MNSLPLQRAKLKLHEGRKPKQTEDKAKDAKKQKHTDEYLRKAFDTACNCTSVIPQEEEKVKKAISEIILTKDDDPHWETRIAYLEHNLDVMKKTYPIYEQEAVRRREKILAVNKANAWGLEKEKCAQDTLYWFRNYAWTADPRKSGIWSLPFILYPFQEEAVDWLEELIFTRQSSGLIEKSRDLGFSWLITSMFYKHWQHPKDGAFNALIGSISADECDKIGDPSSMFEKIRIQARLQPLGLLPKGWDCDIPYMKAVNPENGSTITGETANADFGRSGRYKVILFDEFSAFEFDSAAMTASSQSSPCKIYNSTARGTGNEFYNLRVSGKIPVKRYHWTAHPYKSNAWYEYQKLEMRPVEVAQELDIDYNASQPNKVYPMYNEVYHVVTQKEVMDALPQFNMGGKFGIPLGNSIVMGQDVGQTDEHANVMLWYVTLKQGTKTKNGQDVSGCVLLYREIINSSHSPPREWAERIKGAEGILEKRMVVDRLLSHEAETEELLYSDEYGLQFRRWTPDYNNGISRVRDYLDIININKPHPFRQPTHAPIMGRPTLFLVVADGQGELQWDSITERYFVKPPEDEKGLLRTRSEFPSYHFPKSELGKEVRKMRPRKRFDDAMDNIRCVATECFAPIKPLSQEEEFNEYLPENLKTDNILKMPAEEMGMAFLERVRIEREFAQKQNQAGMTYRERVWQKAQRR